MSKVDVDECLPAKLGGEEGGATVGAQGVVGAEAMIPRGLSHVLPRCLQYRGLNIQWPFSRLILEGLKTDEIRRYPLGHHNPKVRAGERVWLIETVGTYQAPGNAIVDSVTVGCRPGAARIVGIVSFSGSDRYAERKAFRDDAKRHCIKEGGDKDWDGVGDMYAWHIESVQALQVPLPAEGKTYTGFPSPRSFEVLLA